MRGGMCGVSDAKYNLTQIREAKFLKEYWSNGSEFVERIKRHASKVRCENDELMLADLLA